MWLVAIVVLAATVHVVVVLSSNPAPSVFDDELAYQKLAQNLGQHAELGMFGKQGLSYSPLYPLLLAPLYLFHPSGPTAYHAALVVNCLLLALASFPIYRIARFVLSPARSIVAVGLAALAPLMLFSAFVMSENLAYPLFLFAVWAMLETVRAPSVRADIVLLGLCLLCTVARLQFVVLAPAALAAVVIAAIAARSEPGLPRGAVVLAALREHLVLVLANAALVTGGVAIYVGSRIIGLAGMYANVRDEPAPYPWRIARLVAEHVAGLDLSLGVIPFVGTLVAAGLWLRRRTGTQIDAFAAVAAAVSVAVILITAAAAYAEQFGTDLPRIHERYYFYLVPLFLIALVATLGTPRSVFLLRAAVLAAAVGTLLPTLIPFDRDLNRTAGIDSFGLVIFLSTKHGVIGAAAHAMAIAVFLAACLGLLYALARPQAALVLTALASFFVWVSVVEAGNQANASKAGARLAFTSARDWVDRADAGHDVPLVENPRLVGSGLGVGETAFFNLSVDRLYDVCGALLFPQFGEQQVVVGGAGLLLVGGEPIRAAYAVVPAGYGIEGRILATDARAQLVVVQPSGGILRVAQQSRASWACPKHA